MIRNTARSTVTGQHAYASHDADIHEPVARKRLVASLLRDRNVLRVICAPKGYGKTTLLHEYAQEVFDSKDVIEYEGDGPSFLCCLDNGTFGESIEDCDRARLIIIDDLALLDENRSRALSHAIDGLLQKHCEVILSTTPSNDCLSTLQPDRIVLSARDLMVDSEEQKISLSVVDGDGYPRELLEQANGIPSLVWASSSTSSIDCIKAFFEEHLPEEFTVPAELMLLLGNGTFNALSSLGINVREEVRDIFVRSYPLFGVDSRGDTFRPIDTKIIDLSHIEALLPVTWSSHRDLLEGVMRILMDRDDGMRAADVALHFLPEERRLSWLTDIGWELLDHGGTSQVRSILSDTSMEYSTLYPELICLDAWTYYLSGNLYGTLLALDRFDSASLHGSQVVPLSILCDAIRGDSSAADILARSMMDIPSISECLSSCRMHCIMTVPVEGEKKNAFLSDDMFRSKGMSSKQGNACSLVPASMTGTCAGWMLLAKVIDWLGNRVGRSMNLTNTTEEWNDIADLVFRASTRAKEASCRIALHLLVSRTDVPAAVFGRLCEVLKREVIAYPQNGGVKCISQALLVKDYERLGGFRSAVFQNDRRIGCLIVESDGFLSSLMRSLNDGSPLKRVLQFENAREIDNDTRADATHGVDSHGKGKSGTPQGGMRDMRKIGGRLITDTKVIDEELPIMRVDMFGGLDIYIGDRQIISSQWQRRKMRQLIAVLTLYKGREVSRDQLFEALWPDSEFERARDNWYVIWSSFMKLLKSIGFKEAPYLIRSEDACKVNMNLVSSDIFDFEELSRKVVKGDERPERQMMLYSKMEELYRGDLLSVEFGGGYFEPMRIWYRDMFVDAMVTASEDAVRCNEPKAAMWFARKAYEYGVSREDVYRALMRAQLLAGQRSSAMKTYEQCKRYLSEELGIGLSNRTVDFYEQFIAPKFPGRETAVGRERGHGKARGGEKGRNAWYMSERNGDARASQGENPYVEESSDVEENPYVEESSDAEEDSDDTE